MFLDTSGLMCVHNRAESEHQDASLFFGAATTRVTHNYVLAEFVALAQARGLARSPALVFIAGIQTNPQIEVVWVDQMLHDSAMALLQAQLDKTYSLCDAVSFILKRQRGLIEALTTDHHFEQAGFRPPLK
jgi:predicted nucleic acid-binding protein